MVFSLEVILFWLVGGEVDGLGESNLKPFLLSHFCDLHKKEKQNIK